MSVVAKEKKIVLSDTLTSLLEELAEECQNVLRLVAHLEMKNLSQEQIEDILAELTGAIVHLRAHTEGLDDLISDELEKL